MRFFHSWRQDRLLQGVIRNSGYLFSSNSLSSVLSALQGIFAARLLGVEAYGLVSGTVIVFISNVNRLLSFRMNEAVVRFLNQALADEDREQAAALVKSAGTVEALTSLLTYFVLLLLAPIAARYLAKDIAAGPLFAFYGLVILANVCYETSTGVLQATGRFDRLALANLLQSLVTFSLILLAFITQRGVVEVLGAYLVGKSLAAVGVLVAALIELNRLLGRGWWHIPLNKARGARDLMRFALSTNLNGTINLLVRDSETLIIAALRTQTEVGYYRIALAVINLVMLPVEPFIGPTYAEITRTIANRQWVLTQRLLRRVSAIAGVWTLSVGGFLVLLGGWVITTLYGAEYAPAYPAMVILMVGYGYANILQWNRTLLLALGRPIYPLVVSGIVGLVKTGFSLTLLPVAGYIAEAGILSGYFVASVSIILARGVRELANKVRSDELVSLPSQNQAHSNKPVS